MAGETDTERAFREFVTVRWASLVRRAYLLTGDHGRAEDLVQSALERMHKNWGRIEAPDAYVVQVMTNLAISQGRRRRFREIPVLRTPDVAATNTTPGIEDRDQLWRALGHLPVKMRAVLVLRYLDGLSERETAELLGCGLGTVKSQTSRGLERLRQLIPDLAGDLPPPDRHPHLQPQTVAERTNS
jgi:RNA polymerase sigma-70 factor (sigma-E family)